MISFYDSTHRMLPGITTTTRSTVLTTSKGVIVISPIGFSTQQLAEIRSEGEVTAIIEPNMYHTVFAGESRAWFPRADLWGADGLQSKKPKIGWSKILAQDPWPFAPELETILIRGAKKVNESVFFHRATKTLIVTDLVFNMKKRTSLLAPILFRMLGFYKRFAVSNFWLSMMDDERAVKSSLEEILALDFDRLVMAHGEIVLTGGKEKLRAALTEKNLI